MSWSRLRRVAPVILVAAILALPAVAQAHPLGNFTTNTYAGLRIAGHRLIIDYVLDLAEIPAFQARQQIDRDADGELSEEERAAYRHRTCSGLADGLLVQLTERPLSLGIESGSLSFPPGQGGLSTLRLECGLVADLGGVSGGDTLVFEDRNYPDRIGWREIVASSQLRAADVSAESISRRLTSYPEDRLQSPLDQRAAYFTIGVGGLPSVTPQASQGEPARTVDWATGVFTSLVESRRLTPLVALLILAVALGLGAVHAMAPGHGKTVMAAYIAGHRGSPRQAFLIGLTVAATHTVGVLALGLLVTASQQFTAERLYPWLGVASGLLVAAIGISLLARALGGRRHRHHAHGPPSLGWRSLVAMGFAGGLVPSPSALIVLLGALALGRAWLGLLLVLAFGVGMAATLVGAGMLLVSAKIRLDRRLAAAWRVHPLWLRGVPAGTAGLVLLGGLLLAARSAAGI
jgi:nickel/cobalt exporter